VFFTSHLHFNSSWPLGVWLLRRHPNDLHLLGLTSVEVSFDFYSGLLSLGFTFPRAAFHHNQLVCTAV
jgi:hypothetical protein